MKKHLLIVLSVMMTVFSVNTFAQTYDIVELENGYVIKDVNYLQYFEGRQLMDVYLSENATPAQPFVILIHGGAFTNGDKNEMNDVALELLKHNISSVSINYALLSKKFFKDNNNTTYQTMIHNIWNAIQHVQLKADEWNIRKTNYVLVGEEVGAYLALLAGYNFHTEVESIVAISPITDLRDMASFRNLPVRKGQERILFTKLVGGEEYKTSKYLSQTYINANPIDQARTVPTILIHGVKDQVIPYQQSAKLFTFLKDNGVMTKIFSIENGGAHLLNDPYHKQNVLNYILTWLQYNK